MWSIFCKYLSVPFRLARSMLLVVNTSTPLSQHFHFSRTAESLNAFYVFRNSTGMVKSRRNERFFSIRAHSAGYLRGHCSVCEPRDVARRWSWTTVSSLKWSSSFQVSSCFRSYLLQRVSLRREGYQVAVTFEDKCVLYVGCGFGRWFWIRLRTKLRVGQ